MRKDSPTLASLLGTVSLRARYAKFFKGVAFVNEKTVEVFSNKKRYGLEVENDN